MQKFSNSQKRAGKTICFVPTMGFLHKGHLSLLKKGRKLADTLILSIFVNPAQFAPTEDLDKYPKDIKRDIDFAEKEGVDIVFIPNKNDLYDENFQTKMELIELPHHLCGISRPLHFAGVVLIVAKLFNIIKPDISIFGKKDYQQLAVIKHMVLDLNYDIEIIGAEIIREEDGLAMSSRNSYLTKNQRKSALALYNSIKKAKGIILKNKKENKKIFSKEIICEAEKIINSFDETEIDYLKICDTKTLENINEIKDKALFALAVKVGKTRLIDNIILRKGI